MPDRSPPGTRREGAGGPDLSDDAFHLVARGSANEELISIKKELQSSKEELEAAREQFSSVNEELEAINAELEVTLGELSRANSDMVNLLASIQIATIFTDGEGRLKSYTPDATELFKLIPSDVGRPLTDLSDTLDLDDLEADMRRVLRTLEPHQEAVQARSGRMFTMRVLPYRTDKDVIDGLVLTFVDDTALKTAQAENRRLAALMKASHDAIIVVSAEGRVESWNEGAAEAYGYRSDEIVGTEMVRLVPEEDRAEFMTLLDQTVAGTGPGQVESRRLTKDGRARDVWVTITALGDPESNQEIAFAERDVTEQKAAERHRDLLMQELDHRVKNALASIQAIVERTVSSFGESTRALSAVLQGRISALTGVHHSLSARSWVGAELSPLIRQMLAPYGPSDRIVLEGEDLLLSGRVAMPLAMILHELATNAAKHGALGVPDGRVDVSWRVTSGGDLVLDWVEHGGPPASEPHPDEQGFGMTLLRRGLAYELDGESRVEFRPEGLLCTLRVPLRPEDRPGVPPAEAASSGADSGSGEA